MAEDDAAIVIAEARRPALLLPSRGRDGARRAHRAPTIRAANVATALGTSFDAPANSPSPQPNPTRYCARVTTAASEPRPPRADRPPSARQAADPCDRSVQTPKPP